LCCHHRHRPIDVVIATMAILIAIATVAVVVITVAFIIDVTLSPSLVAALALPLSLWSSLAACVSAHPATVPLLLSWVCGAHIAPPTVVVAGHGWGSTWGSDFDDDADKGGCRARAAM